MISQISRTCVESLSTCRVEDQSEEIHALQTKIKSLEQHNEMLARDWSEAQERTNSLQKRVIELSGKVSALLAERKGTARAVSLTP